MSIYLECTIEVFRWPLNHVTEWRHLSVRKPARLWRGSCLLRWLSHGRYQRRHCRTGGAVLPPGCGEYKPGLKCNNVSRLGMKSFNQRVLHVCAWRQSLRMVCFAGGDYSHPWPRRREELPRRILPAVRGKCSTGVSGDLEKAILWLSENFYSRNRGRACRPSVRLVFRAQIQCLRDVF